MKNRNGDSPLFYAVRNGNKITVIELLLASGADVNIQNGIGESPLHYAVLQENIAVVKLLLDWGVRGS
ncbi:ankyrin repeat domain-containing protein [Spiroplasma endosymbiont of Clivina fossor]|uniref:ankyrin repeat domain-containing protein n=1 Tax=Spiroplasma endosymbiont of Clivina fossor TaxID=3066282 RepID=UPI00313D3DF4